MTVFTDNPALMRSEFKSAMLKLSTLGQDVDSDGGLFGSNPPTPGHLLRMAHTCLPDRTTVTLNKR